MENNTATAERPEYLTVAEVSSLYRVSAVTVYRRIADGTLPHIRIGATGPIRIPLCGRAPGPRRGDRMSDRPWDMTWWEYAAQQGLPTRVGLRRIERGPSESNDAEEADEDSGSRGSKHKALRRRWAAQVAEGEVCCARCGGVIWADEPWDLGHDDHDRTRYSGPEHRRCNRATAAHRPQRRRRTH